MFEKYIGRKTNPRLNIDSHESIGGTKKAWVEKVAQDPEFMSWFSGSVVADSSGTPIPVFHGTRGSQEFGDVYDSDEVSELGVHFGTADAASARFKHTFDSAMVLVPSGASHEMARDRILKSEMFTDAEREEELRALDTELGQIHERRQEHVSSGLLGGEKIYPVFIRIVNPVRVDEWGSFTDDNLQKIKKDLIRNFITRDQVTSIQSVKTIEELRKALIELGYDGVVYRNKVEGKEADSYIPIVGPEQIRSVFSS